MLHRFQTFYCSKCGEKRQAPVYCGYRFCPICSVSRRARVRFRLDTLIKNVKPLRHESPKFLTLTVPNVSNLETGVKSLISSFRKLRQSAFWKSQVSGGAAVIEVTGVQGSWHIHLHAVIFSPYILVRRLSKQWLKHSGGKIVWISKIPISAAVAYLTKYLSKTSVPDDCLVELSDALKGVRMFIPFGSFFAGLKGLKKHKCKCKHCGNEYWVVIDFGLYLNVEDHLPPPRSLPPPTRSPVPSHFTFAD